MENDADLTELRYFEVHDAAGTFRSIKVHCKGYTDSIAEQNRHKLAQTCSAHHVAQMDTLSSKFHAAWSELCGSKDDFQIVTRSKDRYGCSTFYLRSPQRLHFIESLIADLNKHTKEIQIATYCHIGRCLVLKNGIFAGKDPDLLTDCPDSDAYRMPNFTMTVLCEI